MAILDKGGNAVALAELTASYGLLGSYTSGTNAYKFPNVAESDLIPNDGSTKFRSEDNIVRASEYFREPSFEAIVMDTDKTTVDFMAFNMNSPSLLYRYLGIKGGYHQEMFAIVNPIRSAQLKTPGGATSNKLKCELIAPNSTVTFSAANITTLEGVWGIDIKCTTCSIAANREFVIVETAV